MRKYSKNILFQKTNKMVNLDSCVSELLESFGSVVEKGLIQGEASEEEKKVLGEKFRTAFRNNMELGLATVFAQAGPAKVQPPPQTEVTIDDLMLQGELRLAGNF